MANSSYVIVDLDTQQERVIKFGDNGNGIYSDVTPES